jgi:hypothetical protein
MRATCPARIILDLTALITFSEAYKLRSPSLCSLPQPPATSSLLGLNIFLNTLFSQTVDLCSSFGMRHQVSHSYKEYKIIILHILIFKFVERRLEVLAVMNGKVNSNTETNQMDRGEAHLWYLGRRRCG